MISGIIKVEVSVISRSRRLRLITLTETLIIPDIPKTESNNCFIIQAILTYSLICRYRLVNNLYVALFPRINCTLLANEKTDGDYNV